jgi:hypothetical protein
LADVLRLLLGEKLSGVDADDYQRVGVFAFQPLQVGQDVHAVDATVSPEVEQHDLAAQFAQAEWAFRVEPLQAFREVGSIDCAFHRLTLLWEARMIAPKQLPQRENSDSDERYQGNSGFHSAGIVPACGMSLFSRGEVRISGTLWADSGDCRNLDFSR